MHVVEFFYTQDSWECEEAQRLLDRALEARDDIILLSYDVDTDAGWERAESMAITALPTMIVDGNRIIQGVPDQPHHLFDDQ